MIKATLDSFVDERVTALEQSTRGGKQVSIEDLLPHPEHPRYKETAVELIRVDLELSYARNEARPLSYYRQRFPTVFADDEAREALAFEEYRQRRQFGDDVSTAEYESAYNIRTFDWSSWRGYDDAEPKSTLAKRLANQPTQRVVDSIEAEPTDSYPVPGHSWGGFHILEELGRGTFGRTFLAQQPALANRQVVLKFSPTTTEEADRLARLQHTNVVPILSIHRHGNRTVICMPYLGRTTLADALRRLQDADPASSGDVSDVVPPVTGPTTGPECRPRVSALDVHARSREYVETVLRLIVGLADGLHHSHQHGILHRDIKPANVVLTDEGDPLLIDFNLAVVKDSSSSSTAVGGTIPYMSPEQISSFTQPCDVDARSDVYGLGVLFYELLARRLPWPPPTSSRIDDSLAAQAEIRKEPPSYDVDAHRTPAVWQMVARCLAFDPAARYQSAIQLRDDILHHLNDLPLKHAPNTSPVELTRKWIRRHPRFCSWTTATTALIAVLIVFLSAWMMREHKFAVVRSKEKLHTFSNELDKLRPRLAAVGFDSMDPQAAIHGAEELAATYLPTTQMAAVDDATWSALPTANVSELSQLSLELASLLANAKGIMARQTDDVDDRNQFYDEAMHWNELASRQTASPSRIVASQRSRLMQFKSDQGSVIGGPPKDAQPQVSAPKPRTAADYLLLGLEHKSRRQWTEAKAAFRKAVELAPEDSSGWLMLARASAELNELPRAIACLDLCEALLPGSVLPLFERGVVRMRYKQYDAAAADFASCLRINQMVHRARLNLALCLIELREYGAAETELTTAIDQDCPETRAYFLRSKVRRLLGDLSGSFQDLQTGMQRQPTDAESWIERGLARLATEPEQALQDFQAAFRLNPGSLQALHNMAHVNSEKLNKPDDALDALDLALRLQPLDKMSLAGRGVLLARRGEVDAALRDAEDLEVLDLDPITQYQVACVYSLCSGHDPQLKPRALDALASSLRRDATILDILLDDPDMELVKSTEDYEELVSAARTIHRRTSPGRNATREK